MVVFGLTMRLFFELVNWEERSSYPIQHFLGKNKKQPTK